MATPLKSKPDVTVESPKSANTMKFLCSYDGKILPRYPDGKLRYHGGENRVLAVDQFISFNDLLLKLDELYGQSITLRYQLLEEDLDALVSICSDEDLKNIVEEYDLASQAAGLPLKIRAFLWRPKSVKNIFLCPAATTLVGSGLAVNPLVQMVPTSTPRGGFPIFWWQVICDIKDLIWSWCLDSEEGRNIKHDEVMCDWENLLFH